MVIWQSWIAKYLLAIGVHVLLNARWQFSDILLLSRNNRVSSFIGLEGVDYVFSQVSLILVATFLF